MPIETPRDRNGTFEPQIIEKHQTRFTGFDQEHHFAVCAGAYQPARSSSIWKRSIGWRLAGVDLERDG